LQLVQHNNSSLKETNMAQRVSRRLFLGFALLGICLAGIFETSPVQAQGALLANPNLITVGGQIQVVWAIGKPYMSDNEIIVMYLNGNEVARQGITGDSGVIYFQAQSEGEVQFKLFSNGNFIAPSDKVTVLTQAESHPTKTPVPITPNGGPKLGNAQQPNVRGGVNLSIVCQASGYDDATNIDNTADGWRCQIGGVAASSPLNWTQICHFVYGDDWHYVKLNNNIDGYRCEQGNSPPVVFVSPTPGQSSTQSLQSQNECSPLQSQVRVGGQGFNSSGINLSAKNTPETGSSVAFTVPNGAVFSIESGPQCGESRTWWKIGYQGKDGWLPEANANVYNFIPNGQLPSTNGGDQVNSPSTSPQTPNCSKALPPHIKLGDPVFVTLSALNFRAGPGEDQPMTTTLPKGLAGVVVSGPICGSDNFWWWQIQTQTNGTWWTIEADNKGYWLEAVMHIRVV
jgi:hypothetical protein